MWCACPHTKVFSLLTEMLASLFNSRILALHFVTHMFLNKLKSAVNNIYFNIILFIGCDGADDQSICN